VYPALSILQAAGNKFEDVLWVGGEGGMEAGLVTRQNIPFRAIPAAGLHGVGLRSLPGNLVKLLRGTSASARILREFNPDVLLFTGGYLAAPMAFAGRRIPTLLYVPDIEPGMALKGLANFADVIAVTAEGSRKFFAAGKNVVVTGYPTRGDLKKLERSTALKQMGLSNDLPVLLIVGGSKGARLINQAVAHALPELLTKMQVIHLTGELDWPEMEKTTKTMPSALKKHYHPFPYLHEEMAAAFSSADVVLSRAGASTLGELPYYGLPAILVPYPFAWRYQKVNADYLAEKGAAVVVENAALEERLLPTLSSILDDKTRLHAMQKAMTSLAQPDAAKKIASLLIELSERKGRS
jgi:UDP-N-acetylglucosamine--N-acetylmuramyl-(pentapeptide) pyrophosphoryl-undecaprenol N-acetylglucosamine transferase